MYAKEKQYLFKVINSHFEIQKQWHIPQLLFDLVISSGLSLERCKIILSQWIKENHLKIKLIETSLMGIDIGNIAGKEGLKRKSKWYFQKPSGAFYSHIQKV